MNITQKSKTLNIGINEIDFSSLSQALAEEKPIRFSIVKSDKNSITIDYAIPVFNESDAQKPWFSSKPESIYDFKPRKFINNEKFNAVMVIPTGIGAEVGGDSGDACVNARLIGSVVDTLITHPNVVNAADFNEMTPNTLYVEGSILGRFMMGTVGLAKSRGNRILLVYDDMNKTAAGDDVPQYIKNCSINAASATRVTLGVDVATIGIKKPPYYQCSFDTKGMAIGKVNNIDILLDVIQKYKNEFDCFALHTVIDPEDPSVLDRYFTDKLEINPWGGIEAMITHTISNFLGVRTAHAPMLADGTFNYEYGIVDPAKSPETLSKTELYCLLKGLSFSPRIITDTDLMRKREVLTNEDIGCLIIPDRCVGIPTLSALIQGIPVIAVDDNQNLMKNDLDLLPWKPGKFFRAKNYLEAVGIINCFKTGIVPENLLRPLQKTKIL